MALRTYLLRRTLAACALVFVVASASLLLARLAPGDFVSVNDYTLDPVERERVRARLGLDKSPGDFYAAWLSRAVRLDFGQSLLYGRAVSEMLGERVLNSGVLASAALVFASLFGLPLGIYVASRPLDVGARVVRAMSLFFISVPPLVATLILIVVAARTGWLPVGGMTSRAAEDLPWTGYVLDSLRYIPLPALALALPFAATLERLQSQSLSETLNAPFVRASLARGASRGRSVLRHAWPVSLRPVLGFYGLMIGSLFSGSFIVEVVTSWPGIGRLMFDALKARDIYLVAGTAAAGAAVLAIGTLTADLLLASVDPRVREARAS